MVGTTSKEAVFGSSMRYEALAWKRDTAIHAGTKRSEMEYSCRSVRHKTFLLLGSVRCETVSHSMA